MEELVALMRNFSYRCELECIGLEISKKRLEDILALINGHLPDDVYKKKLAPIPHETEFIPLPE